MTSAVFNAQTIIPDELMCLALHGINNQIISRSVLQWGRQMCSQAEKEAP